MKVSEQKKLVRKFYLLALLLNVIIPVLIAYIIVGDKKGEVQFVYIVTIIWAFISILIYGVYFLIPEFESKRDVISTFMFPSMIVFGSCFIYFGFVYLLIYTILINVTFTWVWNRKIK
ncbi:hypothetical protein A9Q86_04435 [Flavobacteriales bacterium 33_180_T64]|nr:hypothetical protein A9Q86_04435 [Flavobacteriales bacterium 33_180_T64]